MLPEVIKKHKTPDRQFPCLWQTVIFRNYGLVSTDKLAKTLGCDEQTVVSEAERLGIGSVVYDKNWEDAGYQTMIRHNWYLLNYEQMMTLLGISEATLDYILKEEDFFYVKLGFTKPECEEIKYSPLTDEQKAETEKIAKTVKKYLVEPDVKPFDFFATDSALKEVKTVAIDQNEGLRLVHGYLSPCGDAFMVDCDTYLSDDMLKAYQAQGINALWMHGVLSALSYYPFKPSLCEGYEKRRAEIKRVIAKLNKYGIKLYLYFNEPRSLAQADFVGKYADFMGSTEDQNGALCFSRPEVREYLYTAMKDLLTDLGDLGGIMTITMSENLTHCKSRTHNASVGMCPVCKDIPGWKFASDVNNIIMKAIKDSGAPTKLLANLWSWSYLMGFTEDDLQKGIENLDEDIGVLCVSEFDLEFKKGGVPIRLIDYSISNPGPSEFTKLGFSIARDCGHKVYAKIQASNSWECSAVPYIPAFDLVKQHLENLAEVGVTDYMLSWTLGGYPSPTLGLVAAHKTGKSLDEWYDEYYGETAKLVHEGVKKICEGFVSYPFSIASLYNSPKTLGPANLWSKEREYNTSTMTCFGFDDYESWIEPFPYETYVALYKALLEKWAEGIEILQSAPQTAKVKELVRMAETAYVHFESDYLQTRYSYLKRNWNENEAELREIIGTARKGTEKLISLMHEDARIGFEAANHYFYTDRNLIEKILNLDNL